MFEEYLDKIKAIVKREVFSFLDIRQGLVAIADGYFVAIKRLPDDKDTRLTVENVVTSQKRLDDFSSKIREWQAATVLAEGVFNPELVVAALLPHEGTPTHFRLIKSDDAPVPILLLISEDDFSAVMGMTLAEDPELYEPYLEDTTIAKAKGEYDD